MQNHHQSIEIKCSATECFVALTKHIHLWWSECTEGKANALGTKFTVHFDKTFKKMKVAELISNQKVVWHCIASYLDLGSLQNKSEWNDTRIEWVIESYGSGIVLHVTHSGNNLPRAKNVSEARRAELEEKRELSVH